MGKRGSTAAGATAKKAKTVNADTFVVGNWVQTKIGDKELSHAEKMGLLKNDPAESLAAGVTPRLLLKAELLCICAIPWISR
jgi:hypothetical protein